jgi:FAD/FMN-containing dehydrogenase
VVRVSDCLSELKETFAGRLLTDQQEMAPFLADWRGLWHGQARAVAVPDTADDVARIIRWCGVHGVPVVPQGGNTGLSGGATPDQTGRSILLSLTRLNRIRAIDKLNNTITAEAGCILQSVQDAAAEAGRLFPLSLGAEGSCTIGGNLATNAGGTAVLRYGNARELCLGLEVVTADGRVWNGLRGLRKDNTGYDLRDLFIGSEGTLGVITAAVLKLYPLPTARVAAFSTLNHLDAAVTFLDRCLGRLGSSLTGFELISREALDLVIKHVPEAKHPLETRTPWYVLSEVSDLASEYDAARALEDILGAGLEDGILVDAVIAQSIAQTKALWALREEVSEAQGMEGKTVKHDISIPISRIPEFVATAGAALKDRFPGDRLVVFGHLGDGNLHFNISPPLGEDGTSLVARQDTINRIVHDLVAVYDGSISAEHGLGMLRHAEIKRYKSPVELDLMRKIKDALDPKGLMNPGKVFI